MIDSGADKTMSEPAVQKNNPLAEEIGRLLQSLATAGQVALLGSPDALLRSIVEAAARIFSAAAASILLVNEAEGVLEFKVAYGASNRDLVGTRIPLNQGIAGYVAMSGQPLAISDVAQDTRFNQDFAKSTGYVPRSILATPLLAGDRVLGVMEVLDKINAPSFGMQDMELLSLFARQAAIAIDQAQIIENLSGALVTSLKRLAASDPELPMDNLIAALNTSIDPTSQNDLLKLVELLNEFSRMGEAERETGLKILATFAEYNQHKQRLNRGAGW
jgi:transcriptional regulator with GAF, ATPase, and Fis domain